MPAALHDYLAAAATRRLAPRTLARRLSAMRQFYRFLLIDGVARRRSDRAGSTRRGSAGRCRRS